MRINCLNCGHKIELDDVYDDYDGMVKCTTCRQLLTLKTEDGKLRGVNFAQSPAPTNNGNLFDQLQEAAIFSNTADLKY